MKPTATRTRLVNESKTLTMESLALPEELIWTGKLEPVSPLTSELLSICEPTDDWLFDDNFANNEITLLTYDALELKLGFELTHELINGDDLVVELQELKEENWNDNKLQKLSPTSHLDYSIDDITQRHPITKVPSPFDIGNYASAASFETAILTQLTPPHSPPQQVSVASPICQQTIDKQNNLNDVLQQEQPKQPSPAPATAAAIPVQQQQVQDNQLSDNYNFTTWSGNTAINQATLTADLNEDIEREIQIVDEIVNTRAQELVNWNEIDECGSSQSYASTPSLADFDTDDDWLPSDSSADSSPNRLSAIERKCNKTVQQAAAAACGGTTTTTTAKKRTRPYGRGVEDRKIRKKEQNKNAATRYRQKKKLEMEYVASEEQLLTQRNAELKRILAERIREAKYLKTLIREFHTSKN